MERDRKRIPILMYHRIVPDLFDPSVECYRFMRIAVSQARFEQQMRYIAEHYTVIPLRGLVGFLEGKKEIPDNACVLTFDDSYKDHYRHALPVLKKYGLTATFFLESGHTAEGNAVRFLDRYYFLLDHSPLERFSFSLPNGIEYRSYPLDRVSKVTLAQDYGLKKWLKQSNRETQNMILDGLEDALEVRVDKSSLCSQLYLSLAEMCEMVESGMELGAHTINHPCLSMLDLGTARREIFESGDFVRRISQESQVAFSYPFGDGGAIPSIAAMVKEYGYYGACVDGSFLNDSTTNPFELNRLAMEEETLS